MVLAIDIGNTHILLGCFEERRILFTELLSTDKTSTDLEYAALIKHALEFNGFNADPLFLRSHPLFRKRSRDSHRLSRSLSDRVLKQVLRSR